MVDAVTASNASTRINSGSSMLASNFETFLALLTTQLKNQDPLSPVDSNEFTAQLTQMAGVEQQLLTNDLLKSLVAGQQGGGLSNAANFIGRDATAAWSATKFTGGQATWSYELGAAAETVTLQVLDGSGKVVWSGEAPNRTTGVHDFAWDGRLTGGGTASDGQVYTLKVTAKTAAGQDVDSQVLTRGRVKGVEIYNGETYLSVGNSILPFSSVIALDEAAEVEPEASVMSRVASALNPMNLLS